MSNSVIRIYYTHHDFWAIHVWNNSQVKVTMLLNGTLLYWKLNMYVQVENITIISILRFNLCIIFLVFEIHRAIPHWFLNIFSVTTLQQLRGCVCRTFPVSHVTKWLASGLDKELFWSWWLYIGWVMLWKLQKCVEDVTNLTTISSL